MRFAIYGTGGFGREVAPLAIDYLKRHTADAPGSVVYVDDAEDRPETVNDLPVVGFDALTQNDRIILAMADSRVREKLDKRCSAAGLVVSAISAPTVRILGPNEIGYGAVLCDFVTITANAKIGRGFQANIYSYVAHDCEIGDYVTFAPQAACNGNVRIENHAYIGTGAKLIQGKSGRPLVIGEGALVGMGAVVTKPVEPYTVVAGNPARAIRKLRAP